MNDHPTFKALLDPDDVLPVARELVDRCPVAHVDEDGGYWVVSGYEECLTVLQDWKTFPVGTADGRHSVRIPREPEGINRPKFPPIDSNPPTHRRFREVLNSHLSPLALEAQADRFRAIAVELIEGIRHDGACDFANAVAKVFPARATFEVLFGLPADRSLDDAREWVRTLNYDRYRADPAVLGDVQQRFNAWTHDLIDRRRAAGRDDDIIDALVHAEIDGAPVGQADLTGAIQLLILGGFGTTADALCNAVISLADHPGLEDRLRAEPERLKPFIEEVLRRDPPITARARRCQQDVELGGRQIRAGDRVLVNLVAANRDPHEFPDPDAFDPDREHTRHLSFSGGVHRCVGSTMARLTLGIVLEELLARVEGLRFAPEARETRVSFSVGVWRAVDQLPIEYRARASAPTEREGAMA